MVLHSCRIRRLLALSNRNPSWNAFFQLLAVPTLVTMFVSGLWHGAGYLFILWGLLHGLYLVTNHAWRRFGSVRWENGPDYERLMRPAGFALTFLSVVFAMVLFRAQNGTACKAVLRGMLGLSGIALPQSIFGRLALLIKPMSRIVQVAPTSQTAVEFVLPIISILVLLAIALGLPNSLQLTGRYAPAIGGSQPETTLGRFLTWNPSLPWAVLMATLAAAAVIRLGGNSEFLYWQF